MRALSTPHLPRRTFHAKEKPTIFRSRHHGHALAILLAGACLLPTPGRAADPRASQAAISRVPDACKAEIPRLCPATDTAAPQGRSVAICLKPYKTSLSLPCRKAVRAVFP